MNTFLPTNDFWLIAKILDSRRLMRQIQECGWIINRLIKINDNSIGSSGVHPVLKLWTTLGDKKLIGHLRAYQLILNEEYKIRYEKIKDHASVTNLNNKSINVDQRYFNGGHQILVIWPKIVHDSHIYSLYNKDPSYYSSKFKQFGLKIPNEAIKYRWYSPEEI